MLQKIFSSQRSRPPKTILPIVFWFLFFLIIPILIILLFSFMEKGEYGKIEFHFNISNYIRAFETIYLKILLRSLGLALYTTVSCLVLAYPIAYFMARSPQKQKPIWLALVIIPFWTNFVIRIYALKLVLGETGLLNQLLLKIGIIHAPLLLLDNTFAVLIGMVYNYIPFMILPLYVALDKLDYTLLDAAYDLGANKIQMAMKVLLPLSLPGIVTGSLFVFIPAFGEFVIPDLLGGSQSMYIGSLITETFLKSRDWPFGSALSAFLVGLAMFAFFSMHLKNDLKEQH